VITNRDAFTHTNRTAQTRSAACDCTRAYPRGLDEKEEAFALLNHACAERHGCLTVLSAEPAFDDFRSDRKFDALLGRLGLRMA
jgi:hypothetical protein